jgi:hypothetical protein
MISEHHPSTFKIHQTLHQKVLSSVLIYVALIALELGLSKTRSFAKYLLLKYVIHK